MEKIRKTYSATKSIGQGGFGAVFAGVENKTGKEVVIKHVRFGANVSEAETLKKCQSVPGVVKMLDHFVFENELVIIMSKISPCQDLFDFITDRDRLDENLAKNFFLQMIAVIKALRDIGIVHCDIKDENFVVNLDTLKLTLIDFGAASKLSDFPKRVSGGTTVYFPPEMVDKHCCDPMSMTVWTLGMTLYVMLTGRDPSKFAAEIGSMSDFSLSEKAENLIHECTDPNPEKRIAFDAISNHEWLSE